MQSIRMAVLSLVIAAVFAGFLAASSYAADESMQTVEGTVVCLIPDYANGTVKPVIANAPCDGMPPHQHVLVTSDTVYSLQGLQEGLMKIEKNPQRTNVKITGKVEGNESGWILFVN